MSEEEISLSFEINEENKKVIDFLREEAKNQYWFTIENEHGERLDIVEKEKYDLLQQENQELKKQLEETINLYTEEYSLRHEIDLKLDISQTQQKEFIEYLENMIKIYNRELIVTSAHGNYDMHEEIRKEYKEILSKYKEIIGGKE